MKQLIVIIIIMITTIGCSKEYDCRCYNKGVLDAGGHISAYSESKALDNCYDKYEDEGNITLTDDHYCEVE